MNMTDKITGLLEEANSLLEKNAPDNAINRIQEAILIDPHNKSSWNRLVSACKENNKAPGMVEFCTESIRRDPKNPFSWEYMGYALESLHLLNKALQAYKQAVSLTNDQHGLWERMGKISARLNRQEDALAYFQMALEQDSSHAHTHLSYAKALRSLGRDTECEEHCHRALELSPDYTPALIELGMALIDQGKYQPAVIYFNKAKDTDPGNTEIASGLAQAYDRMGSSNDAYNVIRPLIESGCRDPGIACSYARICANTDREEDAVTFIEDILRSSNPIPPQRIDLHFMAGTLYEKIENFSSAILHFNKANSLKPTNFNPEGYARFIDSMINNFSSEAFKYLPRSNHSDDRPIFIVGMMRSGTSLVEQILASHDDIHGCGELMGITQAARKIRMFQHIIDSDIPLTQLLNKNNIGSLLKNYLHGLPPEIISKKKFTDKMPNNYLNLGLIALLFPEARIIHVKRNPLDTCLSIYFINFAGRHDYAYNLKNLGIYYREYQRLMKHWQRVLPLQILDVEYEELINNTEKVCRAMIDFCGVEWNDKVLNFHSSDRVINTASYTQVRRPIYKSSIGRWKNYEGHLDQLKSALGIADHT